MTSALILLRLEKYNSYKQEIILLREKSMLFHYSLLLYRHLDTSFRLTAQEITPPGPQIRTGAHLKFLHTVLKRCIFFRILTILFGMSQNLFSHHLYVGSAIVIHYLNKNIPKAFRSLSRRGHCLHKCTINSKSQKQ